MNHAMTSVSVSSSLSGCHRRVPIKTVIDADLTHFPLVRPVWAHVQWKTEAGSGDVGRRDPLPSPGVGRLRPPSLWLTAAG